MPFIPLLFAVGGALLLFAAADSAIAYVNGQPQGTVELVKIGGFPVERQTGLQFLAMQRAAQAAGVALVLSSGFRTMAEQVRLYGLYLAGQGNLAAKPGYSNHQNGLAVDISVRSSFSSPEYLWLAANAARYGFRNTGAAFSQPEPWHWERVATLAV